MLVSSGFSTIQFYFRVKSHFHNHYCTRLKSASHSCTLSSPSGQEKQSLLPTVTLFPSSPSSYIACQRPSFILPCLCPLACQTFLSLHPPLHHIIWARSLQGLAVCGIGSLSSVPLGLCWKPLVISSAEYNLLCAMWLPHDGVVCSSALSSLLHYITLHRSLEVICVLRKPDET